MNKKDIVKNILRHSSHAPLKILSYRDKVSAFAPSNIALCKYWGKRNVELNLPYTNSLSISLATRGATTTLSIINFSSDIVLLNRKKVNINNNFYQRIKQFLDLFRTDQNYQYLVDTNLNIPVSAGLASSACGFAALVLALNKLHQWNLKYQDLSILARLGSGSASRSLWHGFVEWDKGSDDLLKIDGFAKKLEITWPELCIGILIISQNEKNISSTKAMQLSVNTSPLYKNWPSKVDASIKLVKKAINSKNFSLLGSTAETNAIDMHSIMKSSVPSIIYSTAQTKKMIKKIQLLRKKQGLELYFTQDAGPNLKLLFLKHDLDQILYYFPDIIIISPFSNHKII